MGLHEQNPRSTHGGSSSEHGSRGSSPRHSSRGRSLDLDLRNAPCYHAAIMRLLPYSMRRGLTLQHPAHPPPPPPAPLPRPHRSIRRAWGPKPRSLPAQDLPSSPLLTTPAPSHTTSSHALLGHSFKSGTVYLEVKLAELQSRHKHASANACAHVPDAHCFGICWQLLGELSRMKTPFGRAFSAICQELDKSIHSSFVAAKSGSISSTFQLVPYFELTCKLGARKLEIEVERENLEANILACQSEISRVEQDVQVSKKKLKLAEGVGREMERSLSTILQDLEATLAQVRTLQEDMLQFKRKMQKAKVIKAKAHEVQYEQMMRQERHAKLEESYKCMWQELQDAQAEIDVVRHEASDSVPKEELGVVKAQVDELQKTLAELQAKADKQITTSRELTPRPFWEELLPFCASHDYSTKSTAELLIDICKQNVSHTYNISQLHEDCVIAQASILKKHGITQGVKDYAQNASLEVQNIPQPKINVKKSNDFKSNLKDKV